VADTDAALEPGEWILAERKRTPQIRAEKYANAEWNSRR